MGKGTRPQVLQFLWCFTEKLWYLPAHAHEPTCARPVSFHTSGQLFKLPSTSSESLVPGGSAFDADPPFDAVPPTCGPVLCATPMTVLYKRNSVVAQAWFTVVASRVVSVSQCVQGVVSHRMCRAWYKTGRCVFAGLD